MGIVVVNYGMGNIHSVAKALERVSSGFKVSVSSDGDEILKACGIVFPGVGAFGKAMENLKRLGLIKALGEKIEAGTPFLGICLGMQLIFGESYEHGVHKGLGVINGRVLRLPEGVKTPHMGWNQVFKVKEDPIFSGIPDASYFYFVHSYYVQPDEGEVLGKTSYGIDFASVIRKGSVYGVQFHPEKSEGLGLRILKNFVSIMEGRC